MLKVKCTQPVQQFTVPQFIDVEDKIIGPITTRQFFISLAGLLLMFVAYRIADFTLFVLLAFLIAIVTGVLAFLRINGRAFHEFALDAAVSLRKPKERIWKKTASPGAQFALEQLPLPKPGRSATERPEAVRARTITELALLVDTGGLIHQREREQ